MRRSQADHPVTGCIGSVQPMGQPITQSEKFGLKVRSPAEYLCPGRKLRWSGRVWRKLELFVGFAPQLSMNIQRSVY